MTAHAPVVATGRPGVASRWTAILGASDRAYRLQIVAGVTVGLAYLAAAALSIDVAVLVLGAAAAAVALVWPAAGLAILALLLPMREPSDAFRPLYLNAVIIGSAGIGCMLRVAVSRQHVRIHPGLALAVGYALYTAVSVLPFVSGYPAEWVPSAGLQTIRIFSAVGIFVAASYVFRFVSPMPFIAVALAGSFIAAALALLAFSSAGPVGLLEGLLAENRGDRASGGFSNANYLGFFAAQSALLALGCWSLTQRRLRPLLAVVIAVILAALAVSFSRNSYLGVTVGSVVLLLLHNWRAAVAFALIAAVAGLVLYPAFLDARLGGGDVLDPTAIAQRAQSENWRRLAAEAGYMIFLTAPVFGVGYGVFHRLSPPYIGASPATYSHNAYVQILAEQGLVGLAMVLAIVAIIAVGLLRSASPLRAAAMAMGSAYLVQSLAINSTQSIQISGLLCLTLAAALSTGERRGTATPKEI